MNFRRSTIWRYILAGITLLGLSFALAWFSSGYSHTDHWLQFMIVLLLGAGILLVGWLAIKADEEFEFPKWLSWLIIAAALLRLIAGLTWFSGLPFWGYGSEVEQAGYIMADAHARDNAAWELASTDLPLVRAFSEYQPVDQYGGMLFLSATVYRFLGGTSHLPLLIVVLSASFSALAILFTWAFAQRAWGVRVAGFAAWIVALFPDAIILGSSQMREAFLMTLVAAALYGLIRYQQERSWSGLVWLIVATVLILPFSPPIAGVFLIVVIIMAVSLDGWQIFRQPRFWIIFAGIAMVAGIGIWLSWERIAPEGINDPFTLVTWWFQQSARWQAVFVKRSSWLIKRIFNRTPDWSHTLLLMVYGVLQPFLPGALLDQGIPFWKGIAIWRSTGWTLMLPFLLVTPFVLWGRKEERRLGIGIFGAVWLAILIASFRSGGDLWDNPRYRIVFISLQAVLVAWVWYAQRESKNPWLWRTVLGLGIILVWFVPWYLGRNEVIIWPVSDVFMTIGLGLISVIIIFSWMIWRDKTKGRDEVSG